MHVEQPGTFSPSSYSFVLWPRGNLDQIVHIFLYRRSRDSATCCVTEDAGGEAVLQRHTRSHASWWSHKIDPSPLIFTKLKANQKTSECTGLPWPKPVRCFQHSWMRRALFQGCFYGCKLFMLGACKMVMLNKSLLQPAECKVVSRGDLSAHELSLFVKSKQAQDRFKKHQRTKFVQI